MAKLSAYGTELVRYFSPRKRALVSVRSDGVTLHRRPYSDWKIYSRKKSEVTLENWKHSKYAIFDELPRWAARCKSLPSVKQIEHWNIDSVCETVDGTPCESDYRGDGIHGPSWLVALGLL
jgi:hypothetical protein